MNLTKPQKLIYDMEKVAGGAIPVICGSLYTAAWLVQIKTNCQAI